MAYKLVISHAGNAAWDRFRDASRYDRGAQLDSRLVGELARQSKIRAQVAGADHDGIKTLYGRDFGDVTNALEVLDQSDRHALLIGEIGEKRPENLGLRTRLDLGILDDVSAAISALLPKLGVKEDRSHLDQSLANYRGARKGLDELATGKPGSELIHPQYLTKLINEHAADDAVFTFDVGTPAIWVARYPKMNGRRRLIGSLVHGSMANAMPQAIGAQAACPGRQIISLSGRWRFFDAYGRFLDPRASKSCR
jgi:hypothetical protein